MINQVPIVRIKITCEFPIMFTTKMPVIKIGLSVAKLFKARKNIFRSDFLKCSITTIKKS